MWHVDLAIMWPSHLVSNSQFHLPTLLLSSLSSFLITLTSWLHILRSYNWSRRGSDIKTIIITGIDISWCLWILVCPRGVNGGEWGKRYPHTQREDKRSTCRLHNKHVIQTIQHKFSSFGPHIVLLTNLGCKRCILKVSGLT